ncbi:MAG: barstar family protein [Betaproteobacteria bacterium]|nr:barstar family protein [Betaproteobacteria bacterium]MBV9361481.1 barstar family protein [Betaproteobacteria bacterium]
MSKLLERLSDPSRSGVYRTRAEKDILEATRGAKLDVVSVDAKENLFDSLARALAFPDWFGRNWDALEDVLGDLSWRKGDGHVVIFRTFPAGEDFGILVDVLRITAEYWAGRGRPFFAVFLDAGKSLTLPDLYRER